MKNLTSDLMEPADSAKVFDTANSKYWFDEDGILCIVTKKAPEQPLEKQKEQVEELKSLLNGKKACMLIDINSASESSRESRTYNSSQLPLFTKAIAFITNSALSRMFANLYLGFSPPPFPSKIFSNEKDAREWLKQYL